MRPRVKLVGEDGNAFAVLGRCRQAARRAGWDEAQIEAFTKEATSGNYTHLLYVVMQHFDIQGEDEEERAIREEAFDIMAPPSEEQEAVELATDYVIGVAGFLKITGMGIQRQGDHWVISVRGINAEGQKETLRLWVSDGGVIEEQAR